MGVKIERAALKAALSSTDSQSSSYLDLESGKVLTINDTATDAETESLRNAVMESYGDRYRYIPGGHSGDDASISEWLQNEGLEADLV